MERREDFGKMKEQQMETGGEDGMKKGRWEMECRRRQGREVFIEGEAFKGPMQWKPTVLI